LKIKTTQPETVRSFIAVSLPEAIRSELADVQEKLKRKINGIKWVATDKIHLTLAFLGDVLPVDAGRVREAVSASVETILPFYLTAKGIGAFPGLSRPRVIWMGLGGEVERVKRLALELADHLEINGFPTEKRPFAGHLTLGRTRERVDALALIDFAREFKDFETKRFDVGAVVVMKSDLKPQGPEYSVLYKTEFGPKPQIRGND
jgi:RNA 2',3'-cyclic 3'-phosphodiesterase